MCDKPSRFRRQAPYKTTIMRLKETRYILRILVTIFIRLIFIGICIIKQRTLPVLKFLWLILQHVLPKGLQRVRDYGFLRGNAEQLRLQILLILGLDLIGAK